jgi:hypothetical protein
VLDAVPVVQSSRWLQRARLDPTWDQLKRWADEAFAVASEAQKAHNTLGAERIRLARRVLDTNPVP